MATASDADFEPDSSNPVRVMLVDDSGVVRSFLRRFIEEDPEMKVLATAANGARAIGMVETNQFDVIVLDIEMPVVDGLTALPDILKLDPYVQVIIASTLTRENATLTMKCLAAGAAEVLVKPNAQELAGGSAAFRQNLVEKVKTLGIVSRRNRAARSKKSAQAPAAKPSAADPAAKSITPAPVVEFAQPAPQAYTPPPPPKPAPAAAKKFTLRSEPAKLAPQVVAIGSSTGGPQALLQFFAALKKPLRQPVFITQHMPPTFTTIFAEHIATQSGLPCREAADGEEVKDGIIYLAPGNYHMVVRSADGKKIISLNQDAPENFCRPAVDPMLRSIVEVYGGRVLAVIFTGMGSDGLKGCRDVVAAGGTVVAQDEPTSVVWGMPGAVAMAGICTQVQPLGLMAAAVREYADRPGFS